MTRNNTNVISFYRETAFQNYKKWWVGKNFCLPFVVGQIPSFQVSQEIATSASAELYNANGNLVAVIPSVNIEILVKDGFSIVKCNEFSLGGVEGNYYIGLTIGVNFYFSDIFSWSANKGEIEIEYSHDVDLNIPSGAFDYTNDFKHRIFLDSEIAKPEYTVEREVAKRTGYNLPIQTISYKLYKFALLLPENVIDAVRLIQLHDYVKIKWRGREYNASEFHMSRPNWLSGGDLAEVEFTFRTDTVVANHGGAAKCGSGISSGSGSSGSSDPVGTIYRSYDNSEAAQDDTTLPVGSFYVLNDFNEQGVQGDVYQKHDGNNGTYKQYNTSDEAQADATLSVGAYYVLNSSNNQAVQGKLFQKQ